MNKEAKARMQEIYNDPSRCNNVIKCPTMEELRELTTVYNLTRRQVAKEFRKMTKAEWMRKSRARSKQVDSTSKPPKTTNAGLGYPFGNCSVKGTNIIDTSEVLERRNKKDRPSRQATKCLCFAQKKLCVHSYESFFEAERVTCKNARWSDTLDSKADTIRLHVKECTRKNCGNLQDCGNKYTSVEHHLSKCVVAKQYDCDGGSSLGLKVMKGHIIPAWAVIGEYTGTVTTRGRENKHSDYIVEVDNRTLIDAEKEGNVTRFINHRCKDFNAVFIPVRSCSTNTIFVRSIKPINENEFVTINYGSSYLRFFKRCLCESCSQRACSFTIQK
jgi:hypothetical protein